MRGIATFTFRAQLTDCEKMTNLANPQEVR